MQINISIVLAPLIPHRASATGSSRCTSGARTPSPRRTAAPRTSPPPRVPRRPRRLRRDAASLQRGRGLDGRRGVLERPHSHGWRRRGQAGSPAREWRRGSEGGPRLRLGEGAERNGGDLSRPGRYLKQARAVFPRKINCFFAPDFFFLLLLGVFLFFSA